MRAEVVGVFDMETVCGTYSWLLCTKPCDVTHSHASLRTRATVVTVPWTVDNASEKLTIQLFQ